MKRMRKWKQAITVLLSVAMLVTAVPQTGAVALAAGENEILEDAGMPAVVQDDLEQDKDGNTDNGDTTVSSGEENSSTGDKSEESDGEDDAGEGSEDQDDTDSNNGDDEESPENPDGEENNEEGTTEDGESEDSDEDGEGVDEEGTIEEQTEEESVSMNTLTAEPAAAEVMAGEPEYVGDIIDGYFLYIGYREDSANPITKEDVANILEYYATKNRDFRRIQVDMFFIQDGNDMTIDSTIINPAIDILTDDGALTINFKDEATGEETYFLMRGLYESNAKVTTDVEVTPLVGQGIKVKLTTDGTIPASDITLSWTKDSVDWNGCLGKTGEEITVLRLDGGNPGDRDDTCNAYTSAMENDVTAYLNIERANSLQSGIEYLFTPLYNDEEALIIDAMKQLSAGERSGSDNVSNIKWKSLNPEVATISEYGTLTAVGVGEAYYYVTYNDGDNSYLEVHKVEISAVTADGQILEYVGEISTTEDGRNLFIDAWGLYDKTKKVLTTEEIVTILRYYAARSESFDSIQIWLDGKKEQTIAKDIVNAAREILNENGEIEFEFQAPGYTWEYWLYNPDQFDNDITLNYAETVLANQGLKVKFASKNVEIPAENVNFSIMWSNKNDARDSSLGAESGSLGIFTHSSNNPVVLINSCEAEYKKTSLESPYLTLHNLNALQLNTEYLLTPIYEDEEIAVGASRQLNAGTRSGSEQVTSVSWKSLDPDVASIDEKGNLTAWEEGETLYYVKYKSGTSQYLEVHRIEVEPQEVSIAFDDSEIDMEVGEGRYLRLRFYPSDAECDPGNPDEITWESSKSDVVRFVEYDDDGNAIKSDRPYGDIQAVGEGTATIKAYYMVNKEDENGDVVKDEEGKPIRVKGGAVAECTVTVTKPLTYEDVETQINSMNLYAVTNLDTKLSDIALPSGWTWKYRDTALANFKDMDGHTFAAVYTDPSGKTITWNLWVRMVTVTGVTISYKNEEAQESEPEWSEDVPASMVAGDSITLGYGYIVENLDGETEYEKVRERMDKRYSIEWTSNPKNLGSVEDNEYKYDAAVTGKKAEKKTFTVSMKDKATNKVLFKASRTITVTVKPTYDFDRIDDVDVFTDPTGQMWLQLQVDMAKEEYLQQPLTVVSEDTSILKLDTKKTIVAEPMGENPTPKTFVTIPCTNPKPGTAWIKVTAPDEMKSIKRYSIEFIDKEPKLIDTTAVSINRTMVDKTATVTVRTRKDCPLASDADISLKLNKNDTASIEAEIVDRAEEDAEHCDYTIKLSLTEQAAADKNLKKGKNTVAMMLTVNPEDAEPEQYTLDLTLNVTDSVPKVSFKQTKNVNLFYNDEEGYGVLNVDANGAVIQNLELVNYTDGKNPKKNAQCDFKLVNRDGTYYIALKDGGNAKNTKGLLTYNLEGYSRDFTTTFTVKTETKKPVIVLSAKSEVLYPNAGYTDSWLTMLDKATGECIELNANDEAQYVENKKKGLYTALNVANFDFENPEKEVRITANNAYNLLVTPDGNIVSRLQSIENQSYSKKADKFNLEIKKDNWTDWVAVSYSLTVNTANPKLVLGASTLKLNKNSEVYKAQMARTSLRLKGYVDYVMQDEWSWVSITGQDEKSKKALKVDNSLVVQYWGDFGDIIVKFNNNKIEKGKYKFNISVGNEDAGTIASTTLTVEVIDTAMDKNLKVSAKGTIDVLDREGTSIAYTPKLSNLSGEIVDGWLEGKDAALFRAEFDNGRLIVHAEGNGTDLSTKNTYQVDAVFLVETQDYDRYEVRTTKPLSIKVKQGKPKLTASTSSNTLYRQLDNTVEIRLDAVLNKKEVEIEDVWLLNYTEDLQLVSKQLTDEEGHDYEGIYDPRTKSVTLALCDRYYADTILQSGKTWKVKLAVRYRDKAGNEKNAEVTCPVVVR